MNLNLLCGQCGAYFRQLHHVPSMKGCSCGIRISLMNEIITLENYVSANGRYLNRKTSQEWTTETENNARKLLSVVNALLQELGIKIADVTSGFRPSAVNKNIPNASKKSLHQQGLAVDILDDKDQTLAKLIQSKPELLKKYNLWLEDPQFTKGKNTNWVHLDLGNRTDRPIRVFKP